jgi:hypothetical protein
LFKGQSFTRHAVSHRGERCSRIFGPRVFPVFTKKIGDGAKNARHFSEIFGDDETLLWHMATDIEPQDGRLWIDVQALSVIPSLRERLPCILPSARLSWRTSLLE